MGRRQTGWEPPHCPNPNCLYFNTNSHRWPFKRKGFYRRRHPPRCVQRFTCLACGRHFSLQTFSTTYWQKRPELIPAIFAMVVGCMANRQIARALGCSPSTVAHHIARLARHCLLFQARDLQQIQISGDIVIDGFESFEFSQYFPFHHNVAVEADTGFMLYHTDSELRRKGRMTAYQLRRRRELEHQFGRPDPQAVEKGIRELLETIARGKRRITVRSDDHRAYPRAMGHVGCRITHLITSSKRRRDARNPLWEVNLLDLMIRHSTAAHKRETIAWAKRRQASAEKLTIFQVWRNYVKKRWEKGPDVSAAMLKGLARRRLAIHDLLRRRLFRWHQELPERWSQYYERRIVTAALATNRLHSLSYAF
jgi:transposase-like protein